MPSANDKSPPVSFDTRFIVALRCILATAVLLALALDPMTRPNVAGMSSLLLVLYVAYSILLYTTARWRHSTWPTTIEPGAVAILILSVGMAWGYGDANAGIRYGLVGAPALGMWGYLAACFTKQAIRHERRLALLKDVSGLSNPRLGIDHALGMIAERLRAFYDADACLLITQETHRAGYQLRRADRRNPDNAVRAQPLPAELKRLLLAWPDRHAVVFTERQWVWQRYYPMASAEVIDLGQGTRLAADERHSQVVAAMLDAIAFITVPLPPPELRGGRLYITTGKQGAFDSADVEFLQLVFEYLRPVLQNIALVDELASEAAEAERRRLALDVHDGIIQPYIGLQMGLEAVRHKLQRGSADVTPDIDCLLHLTRDELVQLRHMVQDLKWGGECFDGLLPAIRRFGLKFTAATGIQVDIEVDGEPHIDDCLAAEVFHIVAEGLSNIRRHTHATTASISFVQESNYLRIQIRNDGMEGEVFTPFTPRSIAERTMALGGEVRIERQSPTHTAVIAEIPL